MEETKVNSFLETERIGKLMRKFSLPCIISLLVGALYNIVDQIFIANADYLGSFGNAANSVVFPLTVIALAIATMIGDGCGAFVSIRLGAKDFEKAHKSIGNSVLLTVASSIVLMVIYLIFADRIITAFGGTVNEETFRLSKEYFFWISLGVPFYMFGQALNPIIRSDGNPHFAMITLLVGAISNCILDPIFIFKFHWGMMGAAVATVIGQILSAVLSLIYLFKLKSVKLCKASFVPDKSIIFKIIPLGASSFLAQISVVFSMAAVLNMCKKYGALDPIFGQDEYAQIPTAVIGIVLKFFQIIMSIAIGMSAGCIPIVGFNLGAGRKNRVRELMRLLMLAEAAAGLVATIIFELFPTQLIGIFGADNESIYYTQFAIKAIRIILCATILSCVNKGVTIFLQSLGKAGTSTLLSVLREIVCGVGLVLLLPIRFGLDGLLWFMAIADIITFVASLAVLIHVDKSLKDS